MEIPMAVVRSPGLVYWPHQLNARLGTNLRQQAAQPLILITKTSMAEYQERQ
jgi:hypothetical protein